MFTGIVESEGIVEQLSQNGENITLTINSEFSKELKVDQSVAHNGVCLTVVSKDDSSYQVVAIQETLDRSNLGELTPGAPVNLERCVKVNDRLDGHIVQGHVDCTGICKWVKENDGSWEFYFEYPESSGHVTVEKGSICVNGVSLTVVKSDDNGFSVCLIPYTFEHTNFNQIKAGSKVNLEFDIVGKYIAKMFKK